MRRTWMFGVAPLWLVTAAPVPPTPAPTPAADGHLPQPPISVRVVRSRAAEHRAAAPDTVQCAALPPRLARPAEPPIPASVPPGTSLAGSGKTLGLLLPRNEKGYPLLLFTRGRANRTYTLKSPESLIMPPSPPVSLGEEGSVAALTAREGFVVYANGIATAVLDDQEARGAQVTFRSGEVMWCPWPQGPAGSRRKPAGQLFKEGEEPALWLRAELDSSDRKVLARVDPQRLDPKFPNPGEWAMGIATRRDGKLWLVGLSSAEVWLASAGGRILRRDFLPLRLRNEEDDEKAMKGLEEEILREVRTQPGPYLSDPTRRQPKSVEVVATGRTRVIDKVMARDNDLVVTTFPGTQPPRALIYVPASGEPAHCWTVPARGEWLHAAVTDEALWWVEEAERGDSHLLYIPWEELLPPPSLAAESAPGPTVPPQR